MTAPVTVVVTSDPYAVVTATPASPGVVTVPQQGVPGLTGPTGAPGATGPAGGAFALNSPEFQSATRAVSVTRDGGVAARTPADRVRDTVKIEDFRDPADPANDWQAAATRAQAFATPLGLGVLLSQMYPIKSTIVPISGSRWIGRGHNTGFYDAQGSSSNPIPIRLFQNVKGSGVTDVLFDNFTLDGRVTYATNASARIFQLYDSSDIRFLRMNVINGSDWHTSFHTCTTIRVRDYRMRWSGVNAAGGCDGLHFLDCSDFVVAGADIKSGDDCVASTCQAVGASKGTIRDVVGTSSIASIVTLGYETTAPNTTIAQSDISITGVRAHNGVNSGSIVKVENTATDSAGNNTVVYTFSEIRVSDVKGTSKAPGIYFSGSSLAPMTDIQVTNVNVTSQNQHGIQFSRVNDFELSGKGVALGMGASPLFSGIAFSNCNRGTARVRSNGSALYGVQAQNVTALTLDVHLWNNGAAALAAGNTGANSGGGVRFVTCTGCVISSGLIGADTSTSSLGVYDDTPLSNFLSPTVAITGHAKALGGPRRRGSTVTTAAPVQGSFSVSGSTLTANTPSGTTVARSSAGVYVLTLATALAGIGTVKLTVGGSTPAFAQYDAIAAGATTVTLRTFNTSGAAADVAALSFEIHDQP